MAVRFYYRAYGRVVDVDTNEVIDTSSVTINWNYNSGTLSEEAPLNGYFDGYMYLTSSQELDEDLDIYCSATINDVSLSFDSFKLELYSRNYDGSPDSGTLEYTFTKTTNNKSHTWNIFDACDDIGATGSSRRMPMVFTVYVKRLVQPPVNPDTPTSPDSRTDYLAYVDGGALGYAPSGHIALV